MKVILSIAAVSLIILYFAHSKSEVKVSDLNFNKSELEEITNLEEHYKAHFLQRAKLASERTKIPVEDILEIITYKIEVNSTDIFKFNKEFNSFEEAFLYYEKNAYTLKN